MNRIGFIGGSDISAVMGMNRWTTPLQLWSEKTGKPIGRQIEEEPNPYGFIPIVLFQPKKDDGSFYGITNIGDIVSINKNYKLWIT